jgi:hypothetical protein
MMFTGILEYPLPILIVTDVDVDVDLDACLPKCLFDFYWVVMISTYAKYYPPSPSISIN